MATSKKVWTKPVVRRLGTIALLNCSADGVQGLQGKCTKEGRFYDIELVRSDQDGRTCDQNGRSTKDLEPIYNRTASSR